MSLLNKASFLVTPNGYKEDKLYAVIPVPSEGAEEVTNGDFATDTDWSKDTGVTISGGNAIFNNSTANNNGIYQAAVFQTNTQYKITAEVSNYSSGNVTAWSGSSQTSMSNASFTGNGTKTWIISTGASNGYLILSSATTNGNFNIDNVSVKEYTSGDMTVTRATTATRVNEAGLVELVPYNLIGRSQELDNAAWGKTAISVTANATIAPDGTLTADKLIPNTTNTNHRITSTTMLLTQGNKYTFSFYAKAGEYDTVHVFDNTWAGTAVGYYNLVTGVTSTPASTLQPTISMEAVGDGWYRCICTAAALSTVSTPGFSRIGVGATKNIIGDGTSGLFVWGAQTVGGTSALTYQKTVDRLDIPRIDYTGGGCPSILLEPQRTNIVLRSEEFRNASFQKNLSSVSANTTTAPDGTLTADTWTGDGTSGVHYLAQTVSETSGVAYTQSVFAKKGTNNFLQIVGTIANYDANSWANFDLENGVVSIAGISATATITDFGNGWYRCTMTATATATASGNGFLLWLITSATAGRVETNSLETSVHLWGAQVEAGAYPTSYIPTTTIVLARNADVLSKTGISDLIGQTEGVMFIESAALFNDLTQRSISISDGTGNNRLIIYYINNSNQIFVYGVANGVAFPLGIGYNVTDETEFAKIAVRYRANDITLWVNGEKRGTDITSQALPLSFNRFGFDSGSGGSNLFAKVKSAQLYKTYLSNDEMAALTTL